MKYSQHFSDHEFKVSADFPEIAKRMRPPANVVESHRWASRYVLEPLREQISAWKMIETPIQILSGYRNAVLNLAVGGYRRSHHMEGHAVDITFPFIKDWHDLAVNLPDMIPALQYILIYKDRNFWHLGFPQDYPFAKYYQFK